MNPEFISRLDWLAIKLQGILLLQLPLTLELLLLYAAAVLRILCGCWGSKLKLSWLHDTHFTH